VDGTPSPREAGRDQIVVVGDGLPHLATRRRGAGTIPHAHAAGEPLKANDCRGAPAEYQPPSPHQFKPALKSITSASLPIGAIQKMSPLASLAHEDAGPSGRLSLSAAGRSREA
jgi:hypothetical protein